MRRKVNIIVLNYNGLNLLKECLPTIVDAARQSQHECRVTILDNKSLDESINYVKANFPNILIHIAKENRFLVSYNHLIANLVDDYVILLNNDIKLDKGFVNPLIDVFINHPDAFMVGPKCWTFDMSQYEGSRTKIRFYFGYMQAFTRYPGYEKDIDRFGHSAAVGSVVAFDRKRFLELGGFDDLYLPGRLEDLDICYRGWKRGWKGYYEPKSLSFHKSSAAFKKRFGTRKTIIIACRNTFLFIWKNIFDKRMLFEHIFFLTPRLIYSLVTFNICLFTGFLQALPLLPNAISRRRAAKKEAVLPDRYVFDMVGF